MIRSTPLKPSRLRPISAKARANDPLWRNCLDIVFTRSGGRCELKVPGTCWHRAVTGHHLRKRRYTSLKYDPRNVLASCAPCNLWVEDFPREAAARGLSHTDKYPIVELPWLTKWIEEYEGQGGGR